MGFTASIGILSLLFFLLFLEYFGWVLGSIGCIISIRYTNVQYLYFCSSNHYRKDFYTLENGF